MRVLNTMGKSSLLIGLLAVALLLSVQPASADTIHYVVSGLAGTATFDIARNPGVVSFTGNDFLVSVTNGSSTLFGHTFLVPPFNLEFSDSTAGGGLAIDFGSLDLQLMGAQLFGGSTSAPSLLTGTWTLGWGTTVTATSNAITIPEPGILLMLGFGIIPVGMLRKRNASR